MDKSRFSLLLLEPGEVYFEDFSCTLSDNDSLKEGKARQGRLKLCSKSLVFEPRDWTFPLVKLYFKDCTSITIVKSKLDQISNIIKVKMKQYAEMLEENILAPYKFKYEDKDFLILFDFASAEECLSQMEQLQRASTLHAPEHNSMVATILHSRYMRMVFDPVMMDDFTEEIMCELQAEKISPLVRHQGKLALTPTTIYFQPFSNVESSPILKLKLCDLRRMYRRRFLLRQVGLELYSVEESSIPHIYLTFQCEDDRDRIYNILEESPNVHLEKVHAEEMTLQWQNGVVSNYDYLMYLNCLADRSKNDLTQYPVFPWVVADYVSEKLDLTKVDTFRDLSKPMGALNPDRLERLKERYYEMSEPKFLYGSHYSAPGLVLFYLVRKYPQYMLCLQNGRFDHPDRMFNSVRDVYNNCLRNMSDFKELVPEFYDVDSKGDFLVNQYEIDFGERHDGTKVNNVALPPWADSPEDFVSKLRQALESEYVSRHLHLWIDLIFGYKQRGEEAVKANNVFHHVCYEGAVDLERVYDMNDRHALEVQIMEFGQVPKQLFTRPHVRKVGHQIAKPLCCPDPVAVSYSVECVDTIRLHKEAVTCVLRQGKRIISVGKDGTLKVYDLEQKKQIRSIILCETPLSSCVMIDEQTVAAGSWDNEIYLYDVEYGKKVESFRAHDDSVSCLLWLQKERLLISGGSDGVVRAWGNVGRAGQALRGLKAEFDHDGNITAIAHRRRRHEIDIISCTSDGEVFIWSLTSRELVSKICVHNASVIGASVVLTGDRVVTASEDGDMRVTDLSVTHSVYQKKFSEALASLCWDGRGTLWLGSGTGALRQWDMVAVVQRDESQAHQDSINSIYFDEPTNTLVTASSDKTVKVWKLEPNS
ncbi:protein FAN-like isoform X2 [Ostrinia furnacalis]|uniref:protein FAN-like isoform X1 n=1 Tax=Ostrinia furnacalis TaxID=93504 RepID=UPI0010395935|nr:protein FAN-like isoform X1 [Ostrinia furnacalis]XP_028155820.1 protein FAN-like isoform X2 [Ostrinia furnacalis]